MIFNKQVIAIAGTFVSAVTFAGGVGYKVGVNRTTKAWQAIVNEELKYDNLAKRDHHIQPSEAPSTEEIVLVDAVRAMAEAEARMPIGSDPGDEPVDEPVDFHSTESMIKHFGIKEQVKPGIDYVQSYSQRCAQVPYIIRKEEFVADDADHEQLTITYYLMDNVLCDDNDIPMDDREGTVGDGALLCFGQWSGDAHIVYVRNEKLGIDFEILLSPGSYAEEVLGHDRSS